MEDNIHPVVRLLAKRMNSHPEEFKFHNTGSLAVTGRWETWINQLGWYFNEAEKELIYGKAKELIFQRVHEEVMDELLNGEERRAKERRKTEELEKLKAQQLYSQVQQQMNAVGWGRQNNILQGANQLGGANGYPYYDSITDTYEFGNGMKMTKAQIENNPGLVNSLKKALGL